MPQHYILFNIKNDNIASINQRFRNKILLLLSKKQHKYNCALEAQTIIHKYSDRIDANTAYYLHYKILQLYRIDCFSRLLPTKNKLCNEILSKINALHFNHMVKINKHISQQYLLKYINRLATEHNRNSTQNTVHNAIHTRMQNILYKSCDCKFNGKLYVCLKCSSYENQIMHCTRCKCDGINNVNNATNTTNNTNNTNNANNANSTPLRNMKIYQFLHFLQIKDKYENRLIAISNFRPGCGSPCLICCVCNVYRVCSVCCGCNSDVAMAKPPHTNICTAKKLTLRAIECCNILSKYFDKINFSEELILYKKIECIGDGIDDKDNFGKSIQSPIFKEVWNKLDSLHKNKKFNMKRFPHLYNIPLCKFGSSPSGQTYKVY